MRYVKHLLSILMLTLLLGPVLSLAQPQAAQAATYTDIGGHWARDAIVRWDSLGALVDFPSGAFKPNTPITRAEFFSLLVNALGATQEADISRFVDVPADAWYYSVVAKAAQMRIANGVSENAMKPLDNIIRQDAATLVARAMGLDVENTNFLYRYNDRDNISNYAETFVSAVTEHGYMTGSYGNFNPRANLSRAEAVKIIDNLFTHYYRPEVGFDNFVLSGNVMTTRTNSVFNNLTVDGDLILTDGVGTGDATLNNCTINGRLLIRGGGANSIVLNDTRVMGGVTVISPSSNPRVVTNGNSYVPQLNAYSSFTLAGTGVHTANIVDDAFFNTTAVLSGVMLDTMYAGGVGNTVDLREGRITNLHVGGAADNAACRLGAGTLVDYFSTVSPFTTVSGAGTVRDAFINAPGATFSMTPNTYTVGANLSSSIGGQGVSGKVLTTVNNVARDTERMAITQDNGYTGGEYVRVSNAEGRSSNTVLITQRAYSELPLENINNRLGYYIGFFIPAPGDNSGDAIPQVTYINSDGGLVTMENVAPVRKNGVYGLEFHVPATRPNSELQGRLNETMFIQWDDINTENLQFHSGWLTITPPTGSEENTLLAQYDEQRFNGYDGTRYTGEEALQRLLAADNALGLDVKNFGSFAAADQVDLAARLLELSEDFGSVESVQEILDQVLTGKAALFAVNNAVTPAQIREALEKAAFAKELNIDMSGSGPYNLLSEVGKQRVSTAVLAARSKDFANAAAVKSAFDKAVSDTRSMENSLLIAMNAAKNPADAQKLVEAKTNADLIGFVVADDPYKSCPAALKLDLGQRLLDNRTYYTVDTIANIVKDFLIAAEESGVQPDPIISSVLAMPTAVTLIVGQAVNYTVTVTTSEAVLTDYDLVKVTYTNPNVINVDDKTGTITAKATGSAKITLASVVDPKKTTSINVSVKAPIPASSVKLDKSYVEVGEGESNIWLIASVTPANSTDLLIWTTTDATPDPDTTANRPVITVDNNGRLTGVRPGFSTVMVRTSSNANALCEAVVISKDPGVMLSKTNAKVGVGQSVTLKAVVSPIGLPNRTVKWTSSDAAIATVDSYGTVRGVSEGTVKIRATSNYDNTLWAECEVFVDPTIRSMTINKSKIVMVPSGIEQLTATALPSYPGADLIKWSLRAATPNGPTTEIATVDENTGVVTAVSPGTVYVMAFLQNDSTAVAECEVEVLNSALTLKFNPTSLAQFTMQVGDNRQLTTVFSPLSITNQTMKWVSSNPDIATVDANGLVVAWNAGTTEITGTPEASSSPLSKITAKVTVTNILVSSFSVTSEIYMYEGTTINLDNPEEFNITVLPGNATNKTIEFTTTFTNKLAVSPVILATPDKPYGITTMEALASTYENLTGDPNAPFSLWTSTPVIVEAKALFGLANVGVKTIRVHIYPYDTKQVSNIKINLSQWVFPVGVSNQRMTVLFNITGRNPSTGDWLVGPEPTNRGLTWWSSNEDIAYVTSGGMLVTKNPGTVDIRATAVDGGESDTVTIVVAPDQVEGINYTGLDNENRYANGKLLTMEVGDSRVISANPSPTPKYDMPFIWRPYKWTYTDPASTTDMAGDTSAGLAWDLLDLATDSTMTNTLTALKPGLIKMELRLDKYYRQESLSLQELQTRYPDPAEFATILKQNNIRWTGWDAATPTMPTLATALYSPNEYLLTLPDGTDAARKLSTTTRLPLVIPYTMDETAGEFFVWIHGKTLTANRFTTPNGLQLTGANTVSLTATLEPLPFHFINKYYPTIAFKDAAMTFSRSDIVEVAAAPAFNPDTGQCTTQIKIKDGAPPGEYDVFVTLTVNTKNETGFRSSSGRDPLEFFGGTMATGTQYLLRVIVPEAAPLMQGMSLGGLSAPIAAPLAIQQPAAQPTVSLVQSTSLSLSTGAGSAELSRIAQSQAIATSSATYASSNPAVAVVDSSGIITAVAPGSAAITATSGNRAVKADVTVTFASLAAPTSKSLTLRQSATIITGKSLTLVPVMSGAGFDTSAVVWTSSKPEIATVDSNGLVKGVKAGKSIITASVPNTKLKDTCTITVSAEPKTPLTGISLSNATLTLEADKSTTLKVSYEPTKAGIKGVSWFSSNNAVAIVNQSGKVTGVSAGTALICAVTDQGGFVAGCSVTVTPKPVRVSKVEMVPTTLSLLVGDRYSLQYIITPVDATNQAVTWKSGNAKAVTVDGNGNITAIKKGKATITVTSADGSKRATCVVTVK